MVVIGELTEERLLKALGGELAAITYSDPPWGQGNLQYWRTHAGQDIRPDWDGFVDRFCSLVAKYTAADGHIFIEMGTRWVDQLAEIMRGYGREETARWTVLYGSPKRPNVLWYSGPGTTVNPEGMSGVAMTKAVINSVATPGALVLDPCCGKGMTARCAVKAGMRFAGVELNPKRAQVTIDWLERNS